MKFTDFLNKYTYYLIRSSIVTAANINMAGIES